MSNVLGAERVLAYELGIYALTIKQEYRDDWFHPMNRDQWVPSFCEWLTARQAKSAEIRTSND